MRTNLHAVLWLCQAALPHLQPGSSIINTTSIQAYDPSPALLDYAATKAALNNLTVNLAASLGPKGIRVNAVAPGPIWTPLQPATRDSTKIETFGADTPLGRAGQPGEVARPTSSSRRRPTRATSRAPSSASPAGERSSDRRVAGGVRGATGQSRSHGASSPILA
jgi:NAD(P)-dependent dehydrogenase (short-subunit alcohol dehydrogenase family)